MVLFYTLDTIQGTLSSKVRRSTGELDNHAQPSKLNQTTLDEKPRLRGLLPLATGSDGAILTPDTIQGNFSSKVCRFTGELDNYAQLPKLNQHTLDEKPRLRGLLPHATGSDGAILTPDAIQGTLSSKVCRST